MVLGFRGQYLNDPARLKKWIDEILPQVMKSGKWQEPHDLGVTTRIEPLVGRETLRRRLVVRGGLAMFVFLTLLILLRINYYY